MFETQDRWLCLGGREWTASGGLSESSLFRGRFTGALRSRMQGSLGQSPPQRDPGLLGAEVNPGTTSPGGFPSSWVKLRYSVCPAPQSASPTLEGQPGGRERGFSSGLSEGGEHHSPTGCPRVPGMVRALLPTVTTTEGRNLLWISSSQKYCLAWRNR